MSTVYGIQLDLTDAELQTAAMACRHKRGESWQD
jgi:hypothetical protein